MFICFVLVVESWFTKESWKEGLGEIPCRDEVTVCERINLPWLGLNLGK